MDSPIADASGAFWLRIRTALLALVAGVLIFLLKFGAFLLTNSVALLSDAGESVVNVASGALALLTLWLAGQPPDENHRYGHGKIEYISSILEGVLILAAGVSVLILSIPRLVKPAPLARLGLGLAISLVASGINLLVALVMRRSAKQTESIALEAGSAHLLTDVSTTGGVVGGLILVRLTGWTILDPLLAILVALHILRTGASLTRRSLGGLLDERLSEQEERTLRRILDRFASEGVAYHDMRTRRSGAQRFVDLHMEVPSHLSVEEAHDLADRVEAALRKEFPSLDVLIHLEPETAPREGIK
ncbi:MAG: cation diffusion facilitator family transporter [Armatimonadota bacterium]|nr:cation diffusion facilitator family transporter [Armatimonadota bacterium]MDR5702773.1 cation diffusion facilitator family transporter [Armatimonadota bacterium]MDR7433610.1 cation diffusion facilitator family transporter [Armatimonadota bacterium]